MPDFSQAFERMIQNEGGYKLTDVQGDRGGQTYAGIARKSWPNWQGWPSVDRGETPPSHMVRDFYLAQFWQPIKADQLIEQQTAETIFDFAVNAGVKTATKLAQIVCGTTPDGVIGQKTIDALNRIPAPLFANKYAIAKMARYAEICNRDRSQARFLLGWINRVLRAIS